MSPEGTTVYAELDQPMAAKVLLALLALANIKIVDRSHALAGKQLDLVRRVGDVEHTVPIHLSPAFGRSITETIELNCREFAQALIVLLENRPLAWRPQVGDFVVKVDGHGSRGAGRITGFQAKSLPYLVTWPEGNVTAYAADEIRPAMPRHAPNRVDYGCDDSGCNCRCGPCTAQYNSPPEHPRHCFWSKEGQRR